MTRHVLIESLSAAAAARERIGGPIHWHTSSPAVIEKLRAGGERVDWIEDCVDSELCERIGALMGPIVEALAGGFAPVAAALDIPEMPANAGRQIYVLVGTLLYKQALLSAWRVKYPDCTVVGDVTLTPNTNGNIGCHRFDTLFANLAAHPDNALPIIAHKAPRRALSEFKDVPSVLTRLLSWSDLSFDQVFWRALRYLARGRRLALPNTRARVIVMRDNEIIREILPKALFSGASIELLPSAATANRGEPHADVPLCDDIMRGLAPAAALNIPLGATADILHELFTQASRWWRAVTHEAEHLVARLQIDSRPTVLVSNAVPGFAAIALLRALRRRGGRVVLAEHGVSAGLTEFHSAYRRWNEAQFSDSYLVCCDNTRDFIRDEPTHRKVHVTSVGLADSIRSVRLRGLQRWLSRMRTGVGRNRVVLYLARPELNNLRWLPYSSHDRDLHELQKKLAFSVLPRVEGRGVFKTYPTQRFLDPMPLGSQLALSSRVKLIDRGDFRYIRALADVIVVESLMSTIGLAFGAKIPIVFLRQQGVDPLLRVEELLEQAIFVIDTRKQGWEDRLVEFLNQPQADICAQWNAKAAARQAFLKQYVNGPEHSGRLGAQAILDTAGAAT